jgi:hypothetical protein
MVYFLYELPLLLSKSQFFNLLQVPSLAIQTIQVVLFTSVLSNGGLNIPEHFMHGLFNAWSKELNSIKVTFQHRFAVVNLFQNQ